MASFSTKADYNFTLAPGLHAAQITRAIVGESKTGKPMLSLRFSICGGKLTWRDFIVLEASRFGFGRLVTLCDSIGVVGAADDPNGLDPFDQSSVTTHLLGKVLQVETTNETTQGHDGRPFVQVRSVTFAALDSEQSIEWAETPALPEDAIEDWDGNRIGPDTYEAPKAKAAPRAKAKKADKPDPNIPF
jgi:hypothetical protein